MNTDTTIVLEDVVQPVVATLGFELVHLEWVGNGKHRRLCVYLDHEQGITLNDCVRMSPIISNALDAAEADAEMPVVQRVLSGPYTLEVSSPGLDRPLSRRSHFAEHVGERVKVQTSGPVEADSTQRNFHGAIEAVHADDGNPDDDRGGTLVLRGDDGQTHTIFLALIRRANLVYQG